MFPIKSFANFRFSMVLINKYQPVYLKDQYHYQDHYKFKTLNSPKITTSFMCDNEVHVHTRLIRSDYYLCYSITYTFCSLQFNQLPEPPFILQWLSAFLVNCSSSRALHSICAEESECSRPQLEHQLLVQVDYHCNEVNCSSHFLLHSLIPGNMCLTIAEPYYRCHIYDYFC